MLYELRRILPAVAFSYGGHSRMPRWWGILSWINSDILFCKCYTDRAELLKQHQQAQLTLAWCDAHIAVIEDKFKTEKLDEHNSEHVLYRDNTLKFVAEKRAEFALLASRVAALDQDRASDVIVK